MISLPIRQLPPRFAATRYPLWLVLLLLLSSTAAQAQPKAGAKKAVDFTLAANGKAAAIYASGNDWPGVLRAAKDLQADVQRVTSLTPAFSTTAAPAGKEVILIGTLGKSTLIDGLVKQNKLDVSGVAGKWEVFVRQVVANPMPGVDRALVIAGSDKRGTIYGIYDVSQQIGVSPWYWWADVPVKAQSTLRLSAARHTLGEPKVKYRGIFINDEAPALSGWSKEKFGGVNSKMYTHMFELILRLKGNYLWPAMWGNMFNVDDPLSPELADMYGIVMGTSHHEPLTRAHEEWKAFGHGTPWNYQTNDSTLRRFWRGGMRRMGTRENIVTVGMRGDGDEPMSEGSNIALLEKIVNDQRTIIAEETHKPADQTPQMWALYKEVQDYYDKGMRVPDDVTLLLCDDNWGNLRKLPKLGDKPRRGGYGIYYHFDYVGGPRNYKWLNTNPLPRIREQMHLAYEHDVRQIWVVNVGDLKPMELPISFFLDYAWNPDNIKADQVAAYT
ncbi:MAG: glycosyl hydrolase, partial [Hymenobacter sp.]